jgi:hypothetical protein
MHYKGYKYYNCGIDFHVSIVGSVVEWSPATRSARVRFPDDAVLLLRGLDQSSFIFFNRQFGDWSFFLQWLQNPIPICFVNKYNERRTGALVIKHLFLAREQKNSGKKFIGHEVLFYETPFLHRARRNYVCGAIRKQSEEVSSSGGSSLEFWG